MQAARLLRVLEGMLRHSVLLEAEELRGPHATALNRIANQVCWRAGCRWLLRPPSWSGALLAGTAMHWRTNCPPCCWRCSLDAPAYPQCARPLRRTYLHHNCLQVAGSGWKLDVEGQRTSDAPQDPQFSTWEEVINRIKGRSSDGSGSEGSGSGSSSGSDGAGAGTGGGSGRVAETAYYTLLGVEPTATQTEIKSAYRKLALQLHPDVSSAPDASERFAAVAAAYDVLSDPESRVLYDRYGAEGMRGKSGGASELPLSALSLSEGVGL